MRIISGKYKRRRFNVPVSFNARPTTDFAKENLFNVLNNIIDFENMPALDLFSGTGSIALELLSRGCIKVVAVEKRREHSSFIKKVAKELSEEDKLKVVNGDVFKYLESSTNMPSFDFVFADPPYKLSNLVELPNLIIKSNLLYPGAIIVLEHPNDYDFSDNSCFRDHRVYGSVNFSFFESA